MRSLPSKMASLTDEFWAAGGKISLFWLNPVLCCALLKGKFSRNLSKTNNLPVYRRKSRGKEFLTMKDYIPDSEADFELWRISFDKYLKNNLAALGLTAGDIAALDALQTNWGNALNSFISAKAAFEAAVALKNDARQQYEDAIRAFVKQLQANPATTDDQRAGLGITIPDTTRTRTPVPATRPIGWVETEPLRNVVNFRDKETPDTKAKPKGYRGCQIWAYTGAQPPTDLDQYQFLATDTQTPYVHVFEMEDAGKTIHYRLRWVNTRDEPGPWSETIAATITG